MIVVTNPSRSRRRLWAVVLAAGEGRRLHSLTTNRSGVAIPKQFCSLWGDQPLLQDSLQRALNVVSRDRLCTVVAADHRAWWEPLLWSLPMRNTIVQPRNLGTGVGVLLSLLHIAQRDPQASVLLLPSDHHVRDEGTLSESMREASAWAARDRERVLLLGVRPEEPSAELGYIVPEGDGSDGTWGVRQFVEKPAAAEARALIERGALWNAFIVCASVEALLRMYAARHGALVAALREAVAHDTERPMEAQAARRVYGALPTVDFSRDVLSGQEAQLRVLGVPSCGWSDLGTVASIARVVQRGRSRPLRVPAAWGQPVWTLSARNVAPPATLSNHA